MLPTTAVGTPGAWRGWDGAGFGVAFIDPYTNPGPPEQHVCAPVGRGGLRWPVTSLVRHQPTGLFVALMQNGARGGGVYYATSPDLLQWSGPALLLPALGLGAWSCGDPAPLAYPSLLDPASADRNFETAGAAPVLFATRFNIRNCKVGEDRELVRWSVRVTAPRGHPAHAPPGAGRRRCGERRQTAGRAGVAPPAKRPCFPGNSCLAAPHQSGVAAP